MTIALVMMTKMGTMVVAILMVTLMVINVMGMTEMMIVMMEMMGTMVFAMVIVTLIIRWPLM